MEEYKRGQEYKDWTDVIRSEGTSKTEYRVKTFTCSVRNRISPFSTLIDNVMKSLNMRDHIYLSLLRTNKQEHILNIFITTIKYKTPTHIDSMLIIVIDHMHKLYQDDKY